MPSIIPSYVFTLFAALIVGAIIVYGCSAASLKIKNDAEQKELANIDQYVATQIMTLLSYASENNQNSTQFLAIPSEVGNQQFWIRIGNDSSGAWVESGFGTMVSPSQPELYIPAKIAASGAFISDSGRAFLKCYIENQTATLMLTGE